MRVAFAIAIILLTVIAAKSQDYHPSPAYYPIELELAPTWVPTQPQTPYSFVSITPGQEYAGRGTWWQRNRRSVAIIGYHLGTVALGAVGDGLRDEGYKEWAHALRAAEVGALIGGPFLFRVKKHEAVWYILDYGFLRLATFDAMYNTTRGLPVLYNGTTSHYDEFMNKIPDHGKAWIKGWSLSLGIAIPLIELK
jgi:hypothetical protein